MSIPSDRIAAVRKLADEGLSHRAIARELGVHHNTVARALRHRGRAEKQFTPVPTPSDERYVYFIQADNGLIKIGVSNDPASRLRALQTGSPINLTLLGIVPGDGRQTEAQLHEKFSAHRARGEWFRPVPQLITYICHTLQQNRCDCGRGGA